MALAHSSTQPISQSSSPDVPTLRTPPPPQLLSEDLREVAVLCLLPASGPACHRRQRGLTGLGSPIRLCKPQQAPWGQRGLAAAQAPGSVALARCSLQQKEAPALGKAGGSQPASSGLTSPHTWVTPARPARPWGTLPLQESQGSGRLSGALLTTRARCFFPQRPRGRPVDRPPWARGSWSR